MGGGGVSPLPHEHILAHGVWAVRGQETPPHPLTDQRPGWARLDGLCSPYPVQDAGVGCEAIGQYPGGGGVLRGMDQFSLAGADNHDHGVGLRWDGRGFPLPDQSGQAKLFPGEPGPVVTVGLTAGPTRGHLTPKLPPKGAGLLQRYARGVGLCAYSLCCSY